MLILAVRIRPPLKSTDSGYELIPQRFQRSLCQATSSTSLSIDAPQSRKIFEFDRVFGEGIQQEGVWEYVNESVEAFVQGYNVSVLAYGQSGSGKSYTMGTSGPVEQSDAQIMGIHPTSQAQCSRFWALGSSQDIVSRWLTERYRRYPESCKSFVPKASGAASIAAFRIVKSEGANPLFYELPSSFITEYHDIETKRCGKGLADEGDIRGSRDIVVGLVRYADFVYLDIQRTTPGSTSTRVCTAGGKSNSGDQGRHKGANHLNGIAPGQNQLG